MPRKKKSDMTVGEVVDSMNINQQKVLYYLVGKAADSIWDTYDLELLCNFFNDRLKQKEIAEAVKAKDHLKRARKKKDTNHG